MKYWVNAHDTSSCHSSAHVVCINLLPSQIDLELLLVCKQFTGLNHLHADMPAATKLEDGDEVTEEILQESLRRGLSWMSALQADDGHWPGDFSAIMYLLPFWVRFPLHVQANCLTRELYSLISFFSFLCSDFRAAHRTINRRCPIQRA